MKKKDLVFISEVKIGKLLYVLLVFLFLINLFILIYAIIIVINDPKFILMVFGFSLPIIILDIMIHKLAMISFENFLGKPFDEFRLYTTGIKIKEKFFLWENIRSVAIDSGRIMIDKEYFKGFKSPVFQKIYLIDKEYKEHNCIVDIDYYKKQDRNENNLEKIKELLLGLDKIDLMHDWAQKK